MTIADAATAGAGSTSAGPDAATLLAAARAVADNARAPYSGWHVGAAAVFAEDPAVVHRGANVENGSFGLALCAERAAIVAGSSAGHRRLARIALICHELLPLEAAALVIPGGTPPGCDPHSWSRSARRRELQHLSPGDPAVRLGLIVPLVATSGAAPRRPRSTESCRRTSRAGSPGGKPIRGEDSRITKVRYVLPRHKAATWVGPGRGRKTTRPGAHGVVELSPCDFPLEFWDRLADLVPPPRKHRHRYHGVFAPNHKLRRAVTALAIGNVGKRCIAATGGHGGGGHATGGCCDAHHKPRSHDTSRIAWAKLPARVVEEFPLECPACGGDRLIAVITEPGPIRKILTHPGEPLEPPPIAAARGLPTDWGELVQVHDERAILQASPDELPVIDIHRL